MILRNKEEGFNIDQEGVIFQFNETEEDEIREWMEDLVK